MKNTAAEEGAPPSGVTAISDDPIRFETEDALDRSRFADGLANLILSADADASLRIAIYGDWGEGKSSVLELMQRSIELQKHICVYLRSWTAKSNEQLLEELITAIAIELGFGTRTFLRQWAKWLHKVKSPARNLFALDPTLKAADVVLGDAVEEVFGALLKKAKGQQTGIVLTFLQEQLAGRKVVVFVDDIDRVRPDLIPDLLLRLRDALNQPGYFYVLALDPIAVERGLESINTKWGEPNAFLEKIVELPRYLPRPTDEQVMRLVESQLTKLHNAPSRDALMGIQQLLPRNPRKLKIFLRLLATAGVDQARFDEDEVQWDLLYLLQLLRVEFPQEAALLAADSVALGDLERGSFMERVDGGQDGQRPDPPYRKYVPEWRQGRFREIAEAIRARPRMHGRYGVRELLLLPDQPPLITRKEARRLLDRCRLAGDSDRPACLRQAVTREKKVDRERLREIFDHLIELRQSQISSAIEESVPEHLASTLAGVEPIDDLLARVVDDLNAFRIGILTDDHWRALLNHFERWASWDLGPHGSLRQRERALLRNAALGASAGTQQRIINKWDPYGFIPDVSNALRTFLSELRSELLQQLSEGVIESFSHRDAFAMVYGDDGSWLRQVAFTIASPLREGANRVRLEELAEASASNLAIQLNFVKYIRLLDYAAYREGLSFDRGLARELIQKDPDFVELLWRGAIVKPLELREAGSLIQARSHLVRQGGVDAKNLALPKWIEQLKSVFGPGIQQLF